MPLSKLHEPARLQAVHALIAVFLAIFAGSMIKPAAAQTPSNVTGVWFDSAGEGAIEVAPCGNRMCGRIVWLKQPLNAEGKPLFDRHNPNASKQSRPICGLQILRDLQPLTDGSWGRGIVYDPKKGAENEASIKPLGGGKLQLTGYGLFGLSKSFEWTRAPADLPRCGNGTNQAVTAPPASGGLVPAANAATPAPATATKPAAAAATAAGAPVPAKATPAVKPVEQQKSAPVPKPSSAAPAPKSSAKTADTVKAAPVKPASSATAAPAKKTTGTASAATAPTKPAKPVASKPADALATKKTATTGTPAKVSSKSPAVAGAPAGAKVKPASAAASNVKPAAKT
ncbi:MAG: DUF2147 domain-containing protein, partial [Hyphomicrobium sp.]